MEPVSTVAEPPLQPAPSRGMDVKPPAPDPLADLGSSEPEKPHRPVADHSPVPPKAPAKPAHNVTGAIVGTVIIVIVLAALATYAYLKSR